MDRHEGQQGQADAAECRDAVCRQPLDQECALVPCLQTRGRRLTLLFFPAVNLKLGGRNWTLDANSLPIAPGTIVFGADIAHAAPGSRGASVRRLPNQGKELCLLTSSPLSCLPRSRRSLPPLTAPARTGRSVASSKDLNYRLADFLFLPHQAEIRSQDAGVESIAGLDEMVYAHLLQYEKTSGQKAQCLVFYRDGVSEGEFKCVRPSASSALSS